MNILRQPEITLWDDQELLPDGSIEQYGEVIPARLTTFGEKVNKVLHFFGMPELEAK